MNIFINHINLQKLKKMKKKKSSKNKKRFSILVIWRIFLLIIISLFVYSISLFPPLYVFIFFFKYFNFIIIWHILLFCLFLVFEIFIFVLCLTLIPALFVKILATRTKEGEYELSLREKAVFKMILSSFLYEPPLALINAIRLVPIRKLLSKIAGLKIGENSRLTGDVFLFQPNLIEIGKNSLIGGYVRISAHVIEKDKLIIKKVKIGNKCMIGADSYILPGAIIEDDVILCARSLVLKDQVLKKGRMYGGIPAKEIKK